MNIKGLGSFIPTSVQPTPKVEKGIKSDISSSDRDANGQMFNGEQKKEHHPPMDDEQKKKAVEHFKKLAVVKDNNLIVQWEDSEGRSQLLLKEPGGKVVRRFNEVELWELTAAKENEKGQLIRRTA